MKISSPPASICTLTESISNQVRSIVQQETDQELQHWLTNNLLPSLAWLASDHLSSCIAMPTDLCNSVVYHLSTLLQLTTDILDTIKQKEGSDDRNKQLSSYLQRKTRQMNILVYIITRSVLQLMSDSMEYLKTQTTVPNEDADKDTSFSEDADLDISSSVVWIDDKDYQLCITLSSKVECNIENCVATITNINGTGGNTDIKVTHYTLLEQSEWVHKVYFETILPRQHRKILIMGRNVSCATFTVTIQDSVQRWKDNPKLQPRLLSAISAKLKLKDTDLQVLQVLKATDDESECVVVLLRLFSPSARTLLRTLRKHQNCIDFHLLNVVDIREGMPAECMHLYGTPELSINVCSSGIATNTILETDSHFLEDPPPNRRISFSSVSKVERNWTADIFISDSIPQIDTLVVQEELFRQEIVHILTTRLPTDDNPNFNCKEIVDEIYQLVEKKYISITNSNFVKELLFQLSIWGNNLAELRYMGESISQQSHRGGKQDMCSTNKSPNYQQVVNLFMNVYILRHHLHLTSSEHMEQIQEEVNSTMDDEVMARRQTTQQEQEERAGIELLARLPPSRNISPMISESVITQVPVDYYNTTAHQPIHETNNLHKFNDTSPETHDPKPLHTFHPSQLRLPDEPSNLSPTNSSPSSVDNSPKHSISVGSVSPINTYGSLVTQAPVEFSSPASPPFSYVDSPPTHTNSSPPTQTPERIPLPPETVAYSQNTQVPLPPLQHIESTHTQEIPFNEQNATPDFMVMSEPLDDDYQSGMEDNTALATLPLDSDYNNYSQDTEIMVNEENLSTLPNMSDETPSYLDTITTPKHPDVVLPPSQHIPLSIPPRSVSPSKKPKSAALNESTRVTTTRRVVARPTPPIDFNKSKITNSPQTPSTPRDDYKKDTASTSLRRTPVTPRESSVNVTPGSKTPLVRDGLTKPRTPSSDRRPSTPRHKDLEKEKEKENNRPTRIPMSTNKDTVRSIPKLPAKAMMALARLSPRESLTKPSQQVIPLGRRASGSRDSIAPRAPTTPRDPSPNTPSLTPRTSSAPSSAVPKTTPVRKTTSSGLPITTRTTSSMRSSSADRASPKDDTEIKRPTSARHRSSSENAHSVTTPVRSAVIPIPSPARVTTPRTNIQSRITIPSPRSKMESMDPSLYNVDGYDDNGAVLNTPRPNPKTSPRTSPRNSTSHMPIYEAPIPVSTRKEIMRLREETTRERVRAKELVTKRRLETQVPTSTKLREPMGVFANPSKQDLLLKKEKRRKELEKLEEERRCDELHQFLKGAAFDWMPAQPPPPPPTTILLTELTASYPLEWCRDIDSLSGTAMVF